MARFGDRFRENMRERREERQERRENRRDNPLAEGGLPEGPRVRDANQTRPTTQTPGLTQPLKAENVRLDREGRIVVTIPLTSEQARQNLYYSYQGQGFSCRPQVTQLQNTTQIESAGRFTIERSNAGGNTHLTVTLDQSLDSLDLRIQGQSVSLNQRELRGVIAAREAQAQAAARDQAARAAHEEARRQNELRQQAEQARQQEARASAVGQVQGALQVLLGQRDVSTRLDNNGAEGSDNTHKVVVKSSTPEEAGKDAAAINQLMRQAGIHGPEVLVVRNELIFDADQIVNYGVDRFVGQFQTISEQVKEVLNVPSPTAQPAPSPAPEAVAPATPSPQPTRTPSPVPPAATSPATPSTPEENPTTTPSPPVPDPARTETPSQTHSPEPTPPPSAAATPTTAPENSTTTAPNLVPPASTTPQTSPEPTETQRRTEIQARIKDLQLDHPQQSALLSMLEQLPIEHLPKAQLQLAQLRADMVTAQEKTASLRVHPELFRQDLARLAREVTQNILENRNSSLEAAAFRDRNVPVLQSLGYEQSEFLGYWERTTKTETQSITRYINPALGLLEEREVSGSQMTFYKLDSDLNRGVTYATSTRGPDGKWAQQPGGFVYEHGGWHDAQSLQRYETVLATLNKHLDTGLTGYIPIWSDSQEEVARALESVPPGSGEYIAQKYKERTGYDLNNVLNWNLDRSHYERGMRQLHGFDAQRQARVLDEALKQDDAWGGFTSADVDALLAATANLTPHQANAVMAEFYTINNTFLPATAREKLELPERLAVMSNLGVSSPREIAIQVGNNESIDEIYRIFELLPSKLRLEVREIHDQMATASNRPKLFDRETYIIHEFGSDPIFFEDRLAALFSEQFPLTPSAPSSAGSSPAQSEVIPTTTTSTPQPTTSASPAASAPPTAPSSTTPPPTQPEPVVPPSTSTPSTPPPTSAESAPPATPSATPATPPEVAPEPIPATVAFTPPSGTAAESGTSSALNDDVRSFKTREEQEAVYQELASRLRNIFGSEVTIPRVRDFNGVPNFVLQAGSSTADSERVTDLLVRARETAGLTKSDVAFIPGSDNSFTVGPGSVGIYAGDLFTFDGSTQTVEIHENVLRKLEQHTDQLKACFRAATDVSNQPTTETPRPTAPASPQPEAPSRTADLDLKSPEVVSVLTQLKEKGIEGAAEIPQAYLSDRGFMREALRLAPELIGRAHPSLQTDQDFLIGVMIEKKQTSPHSSSTSYHLDIINHLNPQLLDNESFIKKLMNDPLIDAYSYASERLRADREFLQSAIASQSRISLESIPEALRQDPAVLTEVFGKLRIDVYPPEALPDLIPKNLLGDSQFWLNAATHNPELFDRLDPALYKNTDFIINVLQRSPNVYEYLPEASRQDLRVAETAYRGSIYAVKNFPESLLANKTFLAKLMTIDGRGFGMLPDELQTDPLIIASAAKNRAGMIAEVPREVFDQNPDLAVKLATQSYSSRQPLEQVLGTLPENVAEIYRRTEDALKVLGFSELTYRPRTNEGDIPGQTQIGRFDSTQEVIRNRWTVAPPEMKNRLLEILGEDYLNSSDVPPNRPRVAMILPHADHNGGFEQRETLFSAADVVDETTQANEAIVYEVASKDQFMKVIEELKAAGGVDHLVVGAHGSANVMSFGGVDPATTEGSSGDLGPGFLTIDDSEVFSSMNGLVRDSGSVILMSCSTGQTTADGRNIAREFHAALPRTNVYAPTAPTETPQFVDPVTGLIQQPTFKLFLDEVPAFTALAQESVEFSVDGLPTNTARAVKHVLEGSTYPVSFDLTREQDGEYVRVVRNGQSPRILRATDDSGTVAPISGVELSTLSAETVVGQKVFDIMFSKETLDLWKNWQLQEGDPQYVGADNPLLKETKERIASALGVDAQDLRLDLERRVNHPKVVIEILDGGQAKTLVTVEIPASSLRDPLAGTDCFVDFELLGRKLKLD